MMIPSNPWFTDLTLMSSKVKKIESIITIMNDEIMTEILDCDHEHIGTWTELEHDTVLSKRSMLDPDSSTPFCCIGLDWSNEIMALFPTEAKEWGQAQTRSALTARFAFYWSQNLLPYIFLIFQVCFGRADLEDKWRDVWRNKRRPKLWKYFWRGDIVLALVL